MTWKGSLNMFFKPNEKHLDGFINLVLHELSIVHETFLHVGFLKLFSSVSCWISVSGKCSCVQYRYIANRPAKLAFRHNCCNNGCPKLRLYVPNLNGQRTNGRRRDLSSYTILFRELRSEGETMLRN